ncbi:MAG: hypothetical protein ACOXZ6_12660 [Syntrophomonadaceae bacterium]
MKENYNHENRHKYYLKCHLIFCIKYRRKILKGEFDDSNKPKFFFRKSAQMCKLHAKKEYIMTTENRSSMMEFGAWGWTLIQIMVFVIVCANAMNWGARDGEWFIFGTGVAALLLVCWKAYRRIRSLIATDWDAKAREAEAEKAAEKAASDGE